MKRNENYLPIGKDPRYNVYHDTIDRQRLNSDILNAGNKNLSIHTTLWDRHNIESRIFLLTGDENGIYKQSSPSDVQLGTIPQLKKEMIEIEKKFTLYQQSRAKQGLKTNDELPSHLLNERLKLEGTLLVRQEELETLQKWLATYVDKKEIEDVSMVLKYGLKCAGRLRGGVLVELDGQKVSIANDGTLFIDCKTSPYNLMSVIDYREMSALWKEEIRKADVAKLKKLQENAANNGLPKPERLPDTGGRRVGINSLPTWPANVEKVDPNVVHKEDEEDSETVMVGGISRKRKQLK